MSIIHIRFPIKPVHITINRRNLYRENGLDVEFINYQQIHTAFWRITLNDVLSNR